MQQVAVQINTDITAARQGALDRLRQTPDYQSAKAELEEKKKAKDEALNALRQVNASGRDTDQDTANVQAASRAWADQIGVLTKLEDETVANDEKVNQKTHDLKGSLKPKSLTSKNNCGTISIKKSSRSAIGRNAKSTMSNWTWINGLFRWT